VLPCVIKASIHLKIARKFEAEARTTHLDEWSNLITVSPFCMHPTLQVQVKANRE
jgi:hypothetical protein